MAEWASAHQLGARGAKAHAAQPKILGSIPTLAHVNLDEHRTGVQSCITTASFQVQIGQETSSTHHNGVGVPQGSVIAPTLFNIALSQLPARQAKIPNIEHAIYTDDVSVWIHTGCLGKQEEALQAALDTIHAYSIEVGLATAPDKTEFVVVHGGRHTKAKEADKDNISLSIGEQPITRKVSIRLLGMFIDDKCTANSWYNRTVAITKQVLHVLPRISNRTRGVKERELRQFVTSFIHAKVMYGLPYHPVTRTQLQALERLNHEARRITTGLSRTPLAALKSCSGLNDLTELLETHLHTQEVRLQSTHAGTHTLAMLGHNITNLPDLPQLSPPWDHIMLTDSTPLPQHMPPEQVERRRTFVKKHAKWTQTACPEEDIRIVYTDAACPQDGTDFATAWVETTTSTQGQLYHATTEPVHSTQAEMHAIIDYVRHANDFSNNSNTKAHFHLFTDSQAAHRACADIRHITVAVEQLRLSVQRLRALGHDLTIHWVPGHSGIPGNEKAHRLARALLLSVHARARSEDTVCLPHEQVESPEEIFKARHYHRAYLLATANPLLTPFPPSQLFSRRQLVTLPQTHSETILTPYLLQRFRQHSSSHREKGRCAATSNLPGTCALCHANADLEHLLWDCPLYSEPRTRTLATIQQSFRPTSLHALACPDPSFPKVIAIELWRSLLAYIQDPAAPPVGSRLEGIQLYNTEPRQNTMPEPTVHLPSDAVTPTGPTKTNGGPLSPPPVP
ncbi:hypothetical protein HPB47_001995 [Ixodes persulcatus]|uniref:Uncharacterized protein n=1 Tax=Ixodes persulcatus TaxID=34615 RepID=A0AC60PNZ2_IXOPE|nr:hypothetical protein HPB47_001995 [Ixodes persulcatus]